jgi:multicomponent Na+:H+ antiporter subunit D
MSSELMPPWPIPPGLLLVAGAALVASLRGPARKIVQLGIPLLTLWQVVSLHGGTALSIHFTWMGYETSLLEVDRLRFAFGLIFAIMAVLGSLYALHVEDRIQNAASWVYAGAALCVTFSGDLLAFVLFWELMGVSSALLVFRRGTVRARKAATRYVAFHALGGTILLAGVLAWIAQGNDLALRAIPTDAGLAGWLLLAGIAINAAIPPLGAWLPDAYAEGTVTGSVFLSAYTTKTAVFALLLLFPGWTVLLWAGVAMTLYGVVYAVLENNIRRLLGYHIISQVGFMVAGAGMGTQMGIDGATAHAFSHILYKSLLFMSAGAVVYATAKEKSTELGGLHRAMPLTLGLYAIGAASISGVPLFNGFVSKAIVVSAAGQGGWPWAEILLTLASVGTFLSIGLKLLWFTFVSPQDRKHEVIRPLPRNMYAAMIAGAALCTFFGVVPGALYQWLPFGTEYHPYTVNHVVTSLQLLTMTAFVFWWLIGKLAVQATISLDTDWLYRRFLPGPLLALSRGIFEGQEAIGRGVGVLADALVRFARNPLVVAEPYFGRGILEPPRGPGGRREYSEDRYRFPVGATVFAVLVVFGSVAVWHLLELARPS